MANNAAEAALAQAQQGTAAEPIVYVIVIVLAAGLVSGAAAYLTQPASASSTQPPLARTPWYTFCLLGVIAAACVPLFLSVVKSDLMKTIFAGGGDRTQSLLVFLGLCLLTALTARSFLDSLSRRILQQMEEIRERQADVEEKVVVNSEKIDDQKAEPVSAADNQTEAATADVSPPPIIESERRILEALARKSYRTVSGIVEDSDLDRPAVLAQLRELAKKALAEPTTSKKSGGLRWMITPLGRRSLLS